MAEPQVRIQSAEVSTDNLGRDVEMGEQDIAEVVEVLETGLNDGTEDGTGQQQEEPMNFVEYIHCELNCYPRLAKALQAI